MKKQKLRRAGGTGRVGRATAAPNERDGGSEVSLGLLRHYIGFRMRRVHDIQTREFLKLTREENLSQGMFTALTLISANAGSSQVQLAREMGLHTSAMVSLIDDLEHRGWVVRQKDQTDRRRHQLALSRDGEKALQRLIKALDEVESDSLKALSETEMKVLTVALDKLYDAYRNKDIDENE